MARITVEDCLKKVSNRFVLVHLGAKRVIQLRKGAKPLYDAPKNKEIVLALREIAAGKVDFESIEKIEVDELAPGSAQSLEAPEEGTPAEEVQKETAESEVEAVAAEETEQKDAAAEETEQKDAAPEQAD